MRSISIPVLLLVLPAFAADHPSAEISNGLIASKIYVPDPVNGYYRGTRFDWSGVIYGLTYNHNFFVIDGQSTGPGFVVRFPFDLKPDRDLKGYAAVRGRELVYLKEIPKGDYLISLFSGFGGTPEHHRFAIENRKTKAGVRMATDKPLSKLQLWSPSTAICPEPFIDLHLEPGQADRWSIRYEFYGIE